MWLIIALSAYLCLSFVSLLDKFVLSKTEMKPAAFVFYSTALALPALFILPFFALPLFGFEWLAVIGCGLGYAFGLWAMFRSFKTSEVSHVGPFIGAIIPCFLAFFGFWLLGEKLSQQQWLAAGLLIIGSLVVAFEKSRRHHGLHRGLLWAIFSGFSFAIFHLSAKYLYTIIGFANGALWLASAVGLCGLLILLLPKVRTDVAEFWRGRGQGGSRNFGWVALGKILALVGVALTQYAVALGSVTLVNALAGVQYGLLVILVALFSKFSPKFLREDYSRWEKIQEAAAVLIIIAGLALLV